jgi:hypothetical protein
MAQALGIKKIALGGGVGSSADPLFAFKKGFSPITKPFYVTRKVLNERRYRELCAWRGVAPRQDGFFPAYRDQA